MGANIPSLLFLLVLLTEKKGATGESTPVIEEGPSSLNVSVNAVASFGCVVSNADVVLWFMNDSSIDYLNNFVDSQVVQKIGNTTALIYNVSFVVESAFETLLNNTGIKCIGVAFTPYNFFLNESAKAILRTQGVLDSPSNISAVISTEAVSITWLPPYTLKGIVIYGYKVNVIVYNSSGIIEQQENSTNVESITFPLVDQSACTVYNSSIQARSDAGLGYPGTLDVIIKYEVPNKLNSSQIGVEVLFTEDGILLQYTIEQDNCAGQRAQFMNATINYATNVTSTGIMPAEANDNGQIIINASVPKSAQGDTVSTTITLTNKEGSTNSEPTLTNLTSTKSISFTEEGSLVSFWCLFAKFSDVNGCHVALKCASDHTVEDQIFDLSIQENSYISELGNITCIFHSCTTYDVYVYDITPNGSIGLQALLEMGMVLCPPPNSTSPSTVSPSSSMTPEPSRSEHSITIIAMAIVSFGIVTILLLASIAICHCYNKYKRRKNHNESEDIQTLLGTYQPQIN